MKDLSTIKALVQSILERDEKARDNDSYLYFCVINNIAQSTNIDLSKISVTAFLLNINALNFPPFESVRRSRQKVQAECPWLAPSREVAELRAENEEIYKAFAIGG